VQQAIDAPGRRGQRHHERHSPQHHRRRIAGAATPLQKD
jgi:hypothetical protein